MGLQRFRTQEEAREASWSTRRGPARCDRIRSLWRIASRLAPGAAPRGLRRFASVEAAERDRQEWIATRALALRERRRRA